MMKDNQQRKELLEQQLQLLSEKSIGADGETLVALSRAMCEVYKALTAR